MSNINQPTDLEKRMSEQFNDRQFEFNEAHWMAAEVLIEEAEKKKKKRYFFYLGCVLGIAMLTAGLMNYYQSQQPEKMPQSGLLDSNTENEAIKDIVNNIETPTDDTEQRENELGNNVATILGKKDESITVKEGEKQTNNTRQNATPITNNSLGTSSKIDSKIDVAEGLTQSKNVVKVDVGNVEQVTDNQEFSIIKKSGTNSSIVDKNNLLEGIDNQEKNIDNSIKNIDNQNIEEIKTLQITALTAINKLKASALDVELKKPMQQPKISEILNKIEQKKAAPSWAFGLGVGTQNLTNQAISIKQLQGNVEAQIWTKYRLSPHWSLGVAAGMMRQQENFAPTKEKAVLKYSFYRTSDDYKLKVEQLYTLRLPVSLYYEQGRHSISGGVAMRYLFAAKGDVLQDASVLKNNKWLVREGLRAWLPDLHVGYQYQLAKHWQIGARAIYLPNSVYDFTPSADGNYLSKQDIYIQLGVYFKF